MAAQSVVAANYKSTGFTDPYQWGSLHSGYLLMYAMTKINDQEVAKDLVQETFLAALENVEQFKGKCSERTWLSAILRYKIIDVYRRNTGSAIKVKLPDPENEESDLFEIDIIQRNKSRIPLSLIVDDNPLTKKEFEQVIDKCLRQLPPLWNLAFSKKYLEGYSTTQICSELCINPSNFWTIVHRTKLRLRIELRKHWI